MISIRNFNHIKSPILLKGDDKIAYRDPAVILLKGRFHLFFTLVETQKDGNVYMYTAKSVSSDLIHWTEPVKLTTKDQSKNYSSPGNVIRYRGRWILCLQTYCRENGEKYGNGNSRIYVMESEDLLHFTTPRLLCLKGDTPEKEMGRMIDPYLLKDRKNPGKWWCFYKQNGVSISSSYDLVHWEFKGSIKAGENVCVIHKDGFYYMFHSPNNGIGLLKSCDCTNWEPEGGLITLGQSEWDWAKGRITAGTVVKKGTMWLMFFHGSGPEDETTMFDTNASIGLAWSRDLKNWDWPGK